MSKGINAIFSISLMVMSLSSRKELSIEAKDKIKWNYTDLKPVSNTRSFEDVWF